MKLYIICLILHSYLSSNKIIITLIFCPNCLLSMYLRSQFDLWWFMWHLISHSQAYTSTPVKLTRGLFITSVSPGVNPSTADMSFWLFSCQTSEGNLGTVSVCLCFWVLGRLMLCEWSCKTLFTALCGSVMFYWTVMKFLRIINPELWPYMSPAVRRRCPRAACLFQLRLVQISEFRPDASFQRFLMVKISASLKRCP